ncbi:hypothetical protein ALP68_04996 [Pseudomonas ficuserectae]|nr:Uncharacterized protein ALO69_05226 [Pseudomonas ficuserectae]RMS38978.1 hypothetical protein ALP68_04996 [Pseudomonas ficuserectae]RMS39417.1 hypothetical protein ALP67_05334 [Pseudomonas ficuserectae]
MRWRVHDPEDSVGDVLRLNWLGARVSGVVLGLITAETYQRKLTLAQPGFQVGDAYASADQIVAQIQRELPDKRLGATVDVTTRIRIVAGYRAQVDDTCPATMRNQTWKQQACGVGQTFDVGVDHGVPVIQIALGRRVDPQRQTGVVDQPANAAELFRQICDSTLHCLAVTHIQYQRMHLGLLRQLGAQRGKTVLATAGQYQRPACFGKTAGTGLTETGSSARDEYSGSHFVLLTWREKTAHLLISSDEGSRMPVSGTSMQQPSVFVQKTTNSSRAIRHGPCRQFCPPYPQSDTQSLGASR